MGYAYQARVRAAERIKDAVIVRFTYYGSRSMNIHEDTIYEGSSRYNEAVKIRPGDEVYAAPEENHKIYKININSWWKRLYVRAIVALERGRTL